MSSPESSSKPRSCTICAQRKVKCDKQSPCGNCRLAGIPCVLPKPDNKPRWARNLCHPRETRVRKSSSSSANTSSTDKTIDELIKRIDSLEAMVVDLADQLNRSRPGSDIPSTRSSSTSPEDVAALQHWSCSDMSNILDPVPQDPNFMIEADLNIPRNTTLNLNNTTPQIQDLPYQYPEPTNTPIQNWNEWYEIAQHMTSY